MAKFFLGALVVLAVTTAGLTAYNEKEQIFVKIFNELHKQPGPVLVRERAEFKIGWIEQKLDHFDASELRTWQMRYMTNGELYEPGGPMFIFVGGEWTINAGPITSSHMYDMAKEHNGYLFYTEHRFYGESQPLAMTNENLKFLDVQQSLADLAHFIRTMKLLIPGMNNSKVILTGGSYSATMVTWFKKLYPDLATGCWASSAPLLATHDYFEYKEVMGQSMKLMGGAACHDRIQRGFAELETMFANKRGAEVKAMLQLCNEFNELNDLDTFTLFYEISEIFAGLVQTHNEGSIQAGCQKIMAGSSDVIGLANYILDKFGSTGCNDFAYSSYLKLFGESGSNESPMRAWIYQTCNEFGWYQTSSSSNQPFGTKYPLIFFSTLCADAYGAKFTNEYIQQRINATNKMFGGLQPKVENLYWTHGQLDPWRAAGLQDDKQATIIPYHAHCKDIDSISDRDTPELRASKEKIAALVRKWVA